MARVRILTLAGQNAVVVQPTNGATTKLFVLCHGYGYGYDYPVGILPSPYQTEWDALRETINHLAERGFTVVCPALWDLSLGGSAIGDTFGNDASTTQLDNVITDAKALPGVSSTNKIVLAGISMGNITTMNWARRFGQSTLAGLFGQIPVCDMQWQYVSNGAASAINAAHGTASYAAVADHDPKVIAADITVPWLAWTNDNDQSAPPSQAVTLAGLIPSGLGSAVARGNGTGHADFNGHDFTRMVGADLLTWLNTLSY